MLTGFEAEVIPFALHRLLSDENVTLAVDANDCALLTRRMAIKALLGLETVDSFSFGTSTLVVDSNPMVV